jgi:hypothetical protein
MKPQYVSPQAVVTILLTATICHANPLRAAVFDFELADQGIIGATDADRARLGPLSELLRSLLSDTGRYRIVSIDLVRGEMAKGPDLRRCNGCATEYAKKLGADVAITGDIQKVSNLILNINVYVYDLRDDVPARAYSVDIRGDNDISFDRGIRFLVRNVLPPHREP